MTKDRWDELLDRDWSDAWDTLPEAPDLVPRGKTAQITLRLPATNQRGDSAVRGMTRLQKLLFVLEQKLAAQTRSYAFNYGPFNEDVNDAARALEVAGFIRSSEPVASGPPSFQQMIATVID